jgi:hypothetical protein
MTGSTKVEQVCGAGAAPTQTRREALKKFGRYAAAAPTAMVLLRPLESHAATPRRRGWRRRDSPY